MRQMTSKKRLTILFNLMIGISILSNLLGLDASNSKLVDAYLDPSTGSMIISAIVGIFATIVLGIKTFWYKLVGIFKPAKKTPTAKDTADNTNNKNPS